MDTAERCFSVNGKKMTAEQLGNINYGFTGSVLGFPAPVLRMAGGFGAIKNSGINWKIGGMILILKRMLK